MLGYSLRISKVLNILYALILYGSIYSTATGTFYGFSTKLPRNRFKKPIMVAENGFGAFDKLEEDGKVHDDYRIKYLKEHIHQMKICIDEGVKVIGYTSWGCIDIVSAGTSERSKRYGYIYVDSDDYGKGTMKRYKKDSFYWYQKVIASHGEDLD